MGPRSRRLPLEWPARQMQQVATARVIQVEFQPMQTARKTVMMPAWCLL